VRDLVRGSIAPENRSAAITLLTLLAARDPDDRWPASMSANDVRRLLREMGSIDAEILGVACFDLLRLFARLAASSIGQWTRDLLVSVTHELQEAEQCR
jgi:hypothetical protein